MEKRIDCLDVTKGIILIVVLFAHSCGLMFGGIMLTTCFMCVFFVLAGYTQRGEKAGSYKAVVKRRACSLLIPYAGFSDYSNICESADFITMGH